MTIARELANLLNSSGKVEGTKIADDAVDSDHYAATSVDGAHIANNTITATQIAGDTITAAEIAANAVNQAELGASSVTSTELANNAVTTAKINNNAVNNDKLSDNAVSMPRIAASGTANSTTFLRGDGQWTSEGAGKILQVVQTVVTAATAGKSGTSMADISGLSRSITPSATSSKILITGHIVVGGTNHCTPQCQIVRGSNVVIGMGDANGSNNRTNSFGSTATQGVATTIPFEFLDSPSTSSLITYKIRWAGGGTFYLNRTYNSGSDASLARTVSVITLYEIGA